MSSSGGQPPHPPPPSGDKGKGKAKARGRYTIRPQVLARFTATTSAPTAPTPFPASPTPAAPTGGSPTQSTPSPTHTTPSPTHPPPPSTYAPSSSRFAAGHAVAGYSPPPTAPSPHPHPHPASPSSSTAPATQPPGLAFMPTPGWVPQSHIPMPAASSSAAHDQDATTPSSSTAPQSVAADEAPEWARIPAPDARPWIRPVGNTWIPSKVGSKHVTFAIKAQYRRFWPTWGLIPNEDRDRMFRRFGRLVQWLPEHESAIHAIFNERASHRLRDMLREARADRIRRDYIGPNIWAQLCAYWDTPAFRLKSQQAKRNRASETGGSMHTGGSISHMQHAINLAGELARTVDVPTVGVPTVFEQTHIRSDTGQFVDERSRQTMEEYNARFSQVASEVASCSGASDPSQLDPAEVERIQTQVWMDVSGGKKKGRIYGTASLARTIRPGSTSSLTIRETPPSGSQDTEEVRRLRQEVEQQRRNAERMQQQMETWSQVMTSLMDLLPPERRSALQGVLRTGEPSTSTDPPPQPHDGSAPSEPHDAIAPSQPQDDGHLTPASSPRQDDNDHYYDDY